MQKYLEATKIIDYNNKEVNTLAMRLAKDCKTDEQIAQNCFEYVRDEIHHSGDYKENITTTTASEVLKHKTGWCYAKAFLLAGLLRANGIPTGFAYQRLSCSEYKANIYCLHGLNWIYLKEHGWYRVDARGNKEGVDAQFMPPEEKLAFEVGENEFDLSENLSEPLSVVVETLRKYGTYEEMVENFPDVEKNF